MRYISLEKMDPDAALEAAVRALKGKGVVAYPTETFYALGVRYDLGEALARLYALKGRPEQKAIPLIVSGPEMLEEIAATVSPKAMRLVELYWPGPLTLLFPAREGLPSYLVSEGRVAVRQPGGEFALALVRAAGFPITSTSANLSGHPPAQDTETVREFFSQSLELVIDGGRTPGGLPSTILDITGDHPTLVREGACVLSEEDMEG